MLFKKTKISITLCSYTVASCTKQKHDFLMKSGPQSERDGGWFLRPKVESLAIFLVFQVGHFTALKQWNEMKGKNHLSAD